jgi:DNA-binding MarR family transcriptional regulator
VAEDSLYEDIYGTVMLLKQVLLKVHSGAEGGDLSRTQLGCLGILSVHESLPPSELAKLLKISKPQTSVLIRKMEELGLIARSLSDGKGDRRVMALSITAKGKTVLKRNVARVKVKMKEKLKVLSEAERKELSQSLNAITRIMGKLE